MDARFDKLAPVETNTSPELLKAEQTVQASVVERNSTVRSTFGARNMFQNEAQGESQEIAEDSNEARFYNSFLENYHLNPDQLTEIEDSLKERKWLSSADTRRLMSIINIIEQGKNWSQHYSVNAELSESRITQVMQNIENRVKIEAPFWHQVRNEIGVNPLDPTLTPESINRNLKYIKNTDREYTLLDPRLTQMQADGVAIGQHIRMAGEFPNSNQRLQIIMDAEHPQPFVVSREKLRPNVTDQTSLDKLSHEIIHTQQNKFINVIGLNMLVNIVNKTVNGNTLNEAQAYHMFGYPASFNGDKSSAEMIAYNYLSVKHLMKEVKSNPELQEQLRTMNSSEIEEYTANSLEKYMLEDPSGEVQKALAATTAVDRLYTIAWLENRRAVAQGREPKPVHERISKIVGSAHYDKDKGWVEPNQAINKYLTAELGIRDPNQLQAAITALDAVRDIYHQDQRIEFDKVRAIAQEEVSKQTAETMGIVVNPDTIIQDVQTAIFERDVDSSLHSLVENVSNMNQEYGAWDRVNKGMEQITDPAIRERLKLKLQMSLLIGLDIQRGELKEINPTTLQLEAKIMEDFGPTWRKLYPVIDSLKKFHIERNRPYSGSREYAFSARFMPTRPDLYTVFEEHPEIRTIISKIFDFDIALMKDYLKPGHPLLSFADPSSATGGN